MKKIGTFLLVILPLICWSQVKITGIVYSKSDKLRVPGVQIIEKGTSNGTNSNINGEFELIVSDKNAILIVSSIGFQQNEVKINGKPTLTIDIKEDCNRDWFDYNKIGFGLLSGLINTPYGGQFNFSFPFLKALPVIKSFASYQTDFKNNNFFNGNIGFYHLLESCNFNSDINLDYKRLKYYQKLNLSTNNFSTNLNFNKFGIITGFGDLRNRNNQSILYGPILGFRTWPSRPLWLDITAKSTIYRGVIVTNLEVNRIFKPFTTFVKFYSIKGFYELSLGIEKEFYYSRKK